MGISYVSDSDRKLVADYIRAIEDGKVEKRDFMNERNISIAREYFVEGKKIMDVAYDESRTKERYKVGRSRCTQITSRFLRAARYWYATGGSNA